MYVPRRHRVRRQYLAVERLAQAMAVNHTSAEALIEVEAPLVEYMRAKQRFLRMFIVPAGNRRSA